MPYRQFTSAQIVEIRQAATSESVTYRRLGERCACSAGMIA